MSDNEKKEIDPMFLEELDKCVLVGYTGGYWHILGQKIVYEFSCLILYICTKIRTCKC